MSNYKAGDRVKVYASGNEAAGAEHGQHADLSHAATIVRELLRANEPQTFEVEYDDVPDGNELVSDTQRFRPLAKKK
jgi:hypothetical protein